MEEHKSIPAGRWFLLVNPNAGIRKGAKDGPGICRILEQENIPFDCQYSQYRNHAIYLAKEAVELGYRRILVAGGDGTLNEVINGIFLQQVCPVNEIILGMIPVGTGNDWGRMFEIPFDYRQAILKIKREKLFKQDVGKVTYHRKNVVQVRYFINVAGMGYDALVAKKTNLLKEKGRGGPLTYLYFVFASLFQYRFMEAVIEVDGKTEFKGEIFSMNVGICRFNGGGMMQVPYAIPDDGLMDVTLIKKAPKWMVVRYANKLYNGTLVDLPIVQTYRGKTIRIRSAGKIFLEVDGESLGHTPLTYDTIPRCLTIIDGRS